MNKKDNTSLQKSQNPQEKTKIERDSWMVEPPKIINLPSSKTRFSTLPSSSNNKTEPIKPKKGKSLVELYREEQLKKKNATKPSKSTKVPDTSYRGDSNKKIKQYLNEDISDKFCGKSIK